MLTQLIDSVKICLIVENQYSNYILQDWDIRIIVLYAILDKGQNTEVFFVLHPFLITVI